MGYRWVGGLLVVGGWQVLDGWLTADLVKAHQRSPPLAALLL